MQLKSILCPVDFSEFSVVAYQHALSLAEYYKARLIALHVVELWKYPFADYVALEADYAQFSASMNEGGEGEYSVGGLRPKLVLRQGNAPRCILSFAQEENQWKGSTWERTTVLVVSSASHTVWDTGPDGRHRLSRITDFSHNSARAREYAISLAAEYSAALISLHVAENVSDVARAEAIIAERVKELGKLVSETKCKNLKVSLTVKFGKPYEEIVRYATDVQASLIIMTARGGDAVDGAVFGSTTYRVTQLGPSAGRSTRDRPRKES
jgi:nucleotide-binding universal stress UspA family protein